MRGLLRSRGRLVGCIVLALMGLLCAGATTSSGAQSRRLGPEPQSNALPVYHAVRRWEQPNRRSLDALGATRALAGSGASNRAGSEVVSLRTADSRTYIGADGTYEAHISQTPINYRNAQGQWTPINNTLTPVNGAAVANRADVYRARIPLRLDRSAVVFSAHRVRVSTRLLAASGSPAKVRGSAARFASVLPGVSDMFRATAGSLVEELTLHGVHAQTTFRYRVGVSRGLRAQVRGGVVRFIDRAGHTEVSFARPFMYDATHRSQGSRPVRVSLSHDGRGLEMTLSVGSAWLDRVLAAGDRVVVDPQTDPGLSPTQTCTIDQSAPTTSECAASSDNIGWDGSHDHRTLLQFNVQAAVPRDVQVLGTRVDESITAQSGTAAISVGAYQVTKPWTTAATWDTTNGSTAWTTAGGDVVSTAADTETIGGTGGATSLHWYPLSLVQSWVDGTAANDGLLLKGTSEATKNEISVDNADLYVYYFPRTGVPASNNFTSFQLNDRMSAGVNDANGNLIIKNQDLSIQGTGLSLVLDRYYNNLDVGWDQGGYEQIYPNTDSPFVYYYRNDGAIYSFRKNSNGSFTSPVGLNDTLVQNSPTQYTLTDNDSQVSEVFQGELGGNFVQTADKDQNGNTIAFTFNTVDQPSYNDPPQQLESITDSQGRKVTFVLNSDDDITSMTDSTGRKWTYTWNSNGQLTSYVDPLGHTTTYAYDSDYNLTQITTPGGRATKFAYAKEASGDDRVTSVTQVTNNTTGAGDTTSFVFSSTPTSPCLSTDYTETIVTDPLSDKTTYCNDPMDRGRVVYDPLGHEHVSTYDVDGNVLQSGTGTGTTITKGTYNANNSLLSETDPTNVTSSLAYGDTSHPYYPTSSTDGQGSKLGYTYYSAGQTGSGTGGGNLKSITANGGATPIYNFAYNANGTIASETDQLGNKTTLGYDSEGNLTKVTPATAVNSSGISQLGATTYTPDALSRVVSSTDGNGNTTTYTYDALDRLTQTKYADGSTITNTYDNDGNLTRQVDSAGVSSDETGTETWTYDLKNRVTGITLPGGQTSSYTYDADNDLTSLTDSTGTTTYGYNTANELTSLAIPGGSCTSSPTSGCATFAYDANGNRTTTNLPNGVVQNETSDADGHVLTLQAKNSSGTVLTKYTYSYALNGAPTDLVQSVTDKDGNTTTYTNDTLDRLTKAVTTGPAAATDTYAYDANDNRTNSTDSNGTYTYAYNADNELCWKATGTISNPSCASPPSGANLYGYDADGNQTSEGTLAMFTYNDRGQQISFNGSGETDAYSYQGPGQDQLTHDGSLIYQNDLLGPGIQTGGPYGAEDYVREPDGQLFSTYSDGQRTYPLFDGQGSLADITNSSGGSDGYFTYDPYGQQLTAVGQDFNNQFGWDAAQYLNSGLDHFGARFYNDEEGRFTQEDPTSHAADPSQYNAYVFGADSPTNYEDPLGLESIADANGGAEGACASGAAIGFISAPEFPVIDGFAGCATGEGIEYGTYALSKVSSSGAIIFQAVGRTADEVNTVYNAVNKLLGF